MQDANSFRSKALALLGIVAVILFARGPAQGAPSTDQAVQQVAGGVSSAACPGPKCPDRSKHAHARRAQAVKVTIDQPPPDRSHPDPVHSTGGPSVNPGH